MSANRQTNYQRAVEACREIRALDRLVRAIVALGPPDDDEPMCHACIWETALKPLASMVVGWERGHPVQPARDPGDISKPVSLSEFLAQSDSTPPVEATTETEKWLRTQQAWDAVTNKWLKLLYDVDPATGHGFPREVIDL